VTQTLHHGPLAAGDAEALSELIEACDRSYLDWAPAGWSVPEVSPDWARRFEDPERWSHCVWDSDGGMVAFACFKPAHRSDTPGFDDGPLLVGVAQLAAVFVHPSWWRQGVATALLELAESEMAARGYTSAQLWTPENAPAECFYTAQGWTRDGRFGWHPWIGLTVIGYAKRLESPH
jgi:GNAT superfamily N-acetyltransferase